jgi:hypothetical protein
MIHCLLHPAPKDSGRYSERNRTRRRSSLAWRWPAALRNWPERITPNRWLQGLIFLPITIVFLTVVSLTFGIYLS